MFNEVALRPYLNNQCADVTVELQGHSFCIQYTVAEETSHAQIRFSQK